MTQSEFQIVFHFKSSFFSLKKIILKVSGSTFQINVHALGKTKNVFCKKINIFFVSGEQQIVRLRPTNEEVPR